MTDLEELWEDYPTGRPPVADLLRAARAEARARRRRHLVRPLLVGATVAAVASGFVVGGHLGSGGVAGSSPSADSGAGGDAAADSAISQQLRHSAFQASLEPADTCTELLKSYQDRALEQVTAYGWSYGGYGAFDTGMDAFRAPMASAALQSATKDGASAPGVANEASGTNVQEAGVDEPDRVKTNGDLLVRAGHDAIRVYDVSGDQVRLTASLDLPDVRDPELLLVGTTLVAVGADTATSTLSSGSRVATKVAYPPAGTRVTTISLADAARPRITGQVRYSGALDTARLQGTAVHLVLADGLPQLPFERAISRPEENGGLTEPEALARNQDVIRETTLDDWLPRYDDGSGSRPLLRCDQVALPPVGVALGTESIIGFDVSRPANPATIGIAGTTSVSYESADHLYLTTGGPGACIECVRPMSAARGAGPLPGTAGRTTIFDFELDGIRATHVATGRVDGAIADRWSMDEADDILRVAVSRPTGTGKRASSVVTMRPHGAELAELGRLDGLGINETLTAARWFDDLAVLSTARQTDPLFTVDLADPAHPRLLGALHIPGFTDYFHPIGDDRLIGIGQSVSFDRSRERQRAQVGLFGISDLADVKQMDVASLDEWTSPYAGEDPHAFTWLPDRHAAISSFRTRNGSTLLGVYTVEGSTLTQKLTPLEGHRWTMTVRTMELPNGKVVLMAGGRVRFLEL